MPRVPRTLKWIFWLWLYTVSVCAAPKTSVSPTTVPTSSGKLPATTSSLPPKIASLSPAGCINATDTIQINGAQFGNQTGRGVAATGYGLHVDMNVMKWSDTTVIVQLPSNSPLVPGKVYSISIESSAHQVLSNAIQGLQICANVANTISSLKQTSIPLPTTNPDTTTTITETPFGGFAESNPPASMSTNTGGNLVDRPMPPPPILPNGEIHSDDTNEPGEILIVNATMQEAETFRQNLNGTGMRVVRRTRLESLGLILTVAQVPKTTPLQSALEQLRQQNPNIWIDTNARYQLQGNPEASARYHYAQTLIKWPRRATCAGHEKIGLVDSIVNSHHPFLQGQQIRQKDFLVTGVAPAPAEHGTAIASLLIGNRQSASFTGLIPGAQLLAANVFRQRDSDNVDTTAELLVRALDWLAGQQVDVINISLGGNRNLLLEAAITRVLNRNIAIVAAAGNGGPHAAPVYPAAQNGVIAVTAVDAALNIYANANQGDYITIAAPGVDVWSAAPGGGGRFFSGTSYAVPFVSAFLALQKNHDTASLQKLVQRQVKDLGSKGHDAVFGWGLIQTQNACMKI